MQEQAIYGKYADYLPKILEDISQRIKAENKKIKQETGHKLFEHFNARVKDEASMLEKCNRKNLPLTPESALKKIRDAIGIRIVCGFIDDIYQTIDIIFGGWRAARLSLRRTTSCRPNQMVTAPII